MLLWRYQNTPLQIVNKSITWPNITQRTPKDINAKDHNSLTIGQCSNSQQAVNNFNTALARYTPPLASALQGYLWSYKEFKAN